MTKLVAIALEGEAFVSAVKKVWNEKKALCPIDLRLSKKMQQEQIDLLQPDSIISFEDLEEHSWQGKQIYQPLENDDALVIQTSGSSGEPKLVVHTHSSLLASAKATSKALEISAGDEWLACLPLAHIGGLSVVTRSLIMGTKLTVLDKFEPESVMKAAEQGATLVSLVTRTLNQIDTAAFRKILIGGGPAPERLPQNVIPTYGMTETGSGVVYGQEVLDGVELKEIYGELFLRGPMLFRAYRSSAVIESPLVDGWFPTGDLGSVDKDGIKVFGKKSEVIRTGGEDVWPEKLEKVLLTHKNISDVAVSSTPDDEWGNVVIVNAVKADHGQELKLEELQELAKSVLPKWYTPKKLVIADSIPRTALGKIKRSEIVLQ